ncbi:unnamed protein product [Victoria cruziana]
MLTSSLSSREFPSLLPFFALISHTVTQTLFCIFVPPMAILETRFLSSGRAFLPSAFHSNAGISTIFFFWTADPSILVERERCRLLTARPEEFENLDKESEYGCIEARFKSQEFAFPVMAFICK